MRWLSRGAGLLAEAAAGGAATDMMRGVIVDVYVNVNRPADPSDSAPVVTLFTTDDRVTSMCEATVAPPADDTHMYGCPLPWLTRTWSASLAISQKMPMAPETHGA